MLERKEITLALRERYLALLPHNEISFYSFSMLFMSRDCTHFSYVDLEDGGLCILCTPPHRAPSAMFPLGVRDLAAAAERLHGELGVTAFAPLGRRMAQQLETALPGKLEVSELRDSADYIYQTEQMISLAGKAYHSKRNFISRFAARFDFDYVELNSGNLDLCLPTIEMWFAEHPGYSSPMFNERTAIDELMANFDALHLKGGALRVDGQVVAFSLGEYLHPQMAHILIEKADTTYPGSYAVINNEFLKHAWSDTTWVNREEDMGLEGLRKAKLSYHPDHLGMVYAAKLKF